MKFSRTLSVLATSLMLLSCASGPVAEPEAPQTIPETPREEPAPQAIPRTAPQTISPAVSPAVLRPGTDEWRIDLLAPFPAVDERNLTFRVFPQEARLQILGPEGLRILEPVSRDRDRAIYATTAGAVLLEAEGHQPLVLPLPGKPETVETKLERPSEVIYRIDETTGGRQPKSVRFHPDGKSFFVANLASRTAVSEYSVEPLMKIRDLQVPAEYRDGLGFVETAVLPGRGEVWVSQMTRNTIHVFDMISGDHLAAIAVSGKWPKVLLVSDDESRVYASCWDSDTVVEIDAAGRRELRSFAAGPVPRGLAFTPEGDGLLATLFESSTVQRIDLESGRVTASYDAAPGRIQSMRHIVRDRRRGEYYVTAMGVGRVYRLSEDGRWLGWWTVGEKPNTCALTPDGRYLFVSCRGPNNPDIGYLFKGYEFGRIYVIDLDAGEVAGWIWGRDQCTGLDVSPDGRYLVFSDFLSDNLELYGIR